MDCEEGKRGGDADSDDQDPFIAEGLSTTDDSDAGAAGAGPVRGRDNNGKRFREALKRKLFRAKEKKRERQAARRAEARGL